MSTLLNGDWDEMDVVTRRAFLILGDEIDSMHDAVRAVRSDLKALSTQIDDNARRQRQSFIALGAAFISAAATVLVAVIG